MKCDHAIKMVKRVMSYSKRPIISSYNYLCYVRRVHVVGKGATLGVRYGTNK